MPFFKIASMSRWKDTHGNASKEKFLNMLSLKSRMSSELLFFSFGI